MDDSSATFESHRPALLALAYRMLGEMARAEDVVQGACAIARRTFLRNVANDSAEMERIVRASGLDWTIARPPRLTNGVLTRAYGVADGRMPRGAGLTISRADVADFLLDELEHPAHIGRIVGLASVKAAVRRAS
ncbi:MAG: NAD(P)H-binding protein [Myxococcales bacterium]